MADKEDELAGTEQPFVAHLVELRDRLVRALRPWASCSPCCRLARARQRSTTCWPSR